MRDGHGVIPRHADLDVYIQRLFRRPEAAMAVLGRGPSAAPLNDQADSLSLSVPMAERVSLLDNELRGQLRLLADQAAEFSDADSLNRLEWEGIALLIAIRELRRHFPRVVTLSPRISAVRPASCLRPTANPLLTTFTVCPLASGGNGGANPLGAASPASIRLGSPLRLVGARVDSRGNCIRNTRGYRARASNRGAPWPPWGITNLSWVRF